MPFDLLGNEKVANLDGVPAEYQGFYSKGADETFVLNPVAKELAEDKAKLAKALDNERKSTKSATGELDKWKNLGLTPDEIKAIADKAVKDREEQELAKGNFEAVKKQMLEQHEKEKLSLVADKDKMFGAVKKNLITAAAVAEIAAANGIPELLLPHIENKVNVTQEGEEFKVHILDKDGKPRVNAKGEDLTIKDLVSELKEHATFSHAFKGSGASGSGASGGNSNNNNSTQTKLHKDMTAADKSAYIKEHGFTAWQEFVHKSTVKR